MAKKYGCARTKRIKLVLLAGFWLQNEEVTRCHKRQKDDLDIINPRLAAIRSDGDQSQHGGVSGIGPWCQAGITVILLSDAVQAFAMTAEAAYKSGVRIMSAVSPRVWASAPTADILSNWWGDDVDVAQLLREGRKYDSAYDAGLIRKEIGFTADNSMKRFFAWP